MNYRKTGYLFLLAILLFSGYYFSNPLIKKFNYLSKLGNTVSLIISLIALIVSIIALIYTIRTFLLKEGEKFRFIHSEVESADSDDKYVRSITLENLKDKSVVIFAIYFKIGNNSYIILEEFGNDPLIIKPFEVYSKKYDPIICYSWSLKRTKIDHLFDDRSLKRSLVVSTTNGKFEIDSLMNKWSIHRDLFKNRLSNITRVRRFMYKDKSYGKNVKYLADLTFENGDSQVLKLMKDSFKYKKFNKLNLNKECLKDKESLKEHLLLKTEDEIKINSVKIIDWEERIKDRFDVFKQDEIYRPQNYNKFEYYILGPLISWYRSYKFRKNKEN